MIGNFCLLSKTIIYFIQKSSTMLHFSVYTTIFGHTYTWFKNKSCRRKHVAIFGIFQYSAQQEAKIKSEL